MFERVDADFEEAERLGCVNFPHSVLNWREMLKRSQKKRKKKKKAYNEKDYAFGIYQILPYPPDPDDADPIHSFFDWFTSKPPENPFDHLFETFG